MYSPPTGQGGRPKQSRIVIKVDDEQKGAASRNARRGGRGRRGFSVAALVALGLLVVIGIGGYLWWQSYKRSPAYSLALLVDAAQRDDTQAIEQLVDSDRVAQSLAPQVIDNALSRVGGVGTLSAPRRQIEGALPMLLPSVRGQVRDEVARGIKQVAAQGGDRLPFFLLALAIPRMWDNIREEGDAATVTFKAGERAVDLTMQRADERWKIVGIKDDQLAASIAERIIQSLPVQPGALRQLQNQRNGPAPRQR